MDNPLGASECSASYQQAEARLAPGTSSGQALDQVAALDSHLSSRSTQALGVIHKAISYQRRILATKLEGSRLLNSTQRGTRAFTVGALAALTVAPLGDPLMPVATAAATGIIELLWSYISNEGH